MTPLPIAFYAPLKSPDHPSPSGDRTMARLLLAALRQGGFAPTLASRLRTFEPSGDPVRQEALREAGLREAGRLTEGFRRAPPTERPRLWFTYHCYYKAPDWLGPAVSRALGIPYVVAEGSRAAKRAGGRWSIGHSGAEAALDGASLLFAMTGHDREALAQARRPGQRLVDLPPFLDLAAWPPPPSGSVEIAEAPAPRLLTVAMMRDGDKLASYRILAASLNLAQARQAESWTLDIVGDGPARAEIEALFVPFGPRIVWHGLMEDRGRLAALYRQADLLVWPAVNEAYGMALLEAQAMACPVLAGDSGGVADAMRAGETGILVPPGDPAAFADALCGLLIDRALIRRMGAAARRFVVEHRNVGGAAEILRGALAPLVTEELAA
ncbi:glycosyltransferase family 4 protein [uncultured Enterovirga sp.]|uniref:glycosyltransferase family 4 protein n=1 Tax=uncultured Enterovirga sp. TaxID=2026352 RepID=UPI0035CB5776